MSASPTTQPTAPSDNRYHPGHGLEPLVDILAKAISSATYGLATLSRDPKTAREQLRQVCRLTLAELDATEPNAEPAVELDTMSFTGGRS